jgi:hypothetical protein
MIEMSLMDPSKETDNKLRWETHIEGVRFKLYIPKKQVPWPWPKRIQVFVTDRVNTARHRRGKQGRGLSAIVHRVTELTETVRFRPIGPPEQWEIGEPYIPYSFLPNRSALAIRIDVLWDMSAGTWSPGDQVRRRSRRKLEE